MKVRLITAAVVLPLMLVLIWVPGLKWGFALFVTALAAIGLHEYYTIARAREIVPQAGGGIVMGAIITFSGYFGDPALTNMALYAGALVVSALHLARGQRSVAAIASSVFGLFYVGWLGAHLNLLHNVPILGPGLVMVLFVAVVLTDSAAYFVGRKIGRHKMAPTISPNKSWEGAVAGLLFSVVGLIVLYALRQRYRWEVLPDWSLLYYLLAGALLSAVAQMGDFVESALKRDAGTKDSGGFFPGHGGVLDRCDGFLYAAPVLYYIVFIWFRIAA